MYYIELLNHEFKYLKSCLLDFTDNLDEAYKTKCHESIEDCRVLLIKQRIECKINLYRPC